MGLTTLETMFGSLPSRNARIAPDNPGGGNRVYTPQELQLLHQHNQQHPELAFDDTMRSHFLDTDVAAFRAQTTIIPIHIFGARDVRVAANAKLHPQLDDETQNDLRTVRSITGVLSGIVSTVQAQNLWFPIMFGWSRQRREWLFAKLVGFIDPRPACLPRRVPVGRDRGRGLGHAGFLGGVGPSRAVLESAAFRVRSGVVELGACRRRPSDAGGFDEGRRAADGDAGSARQHCRHQFDFGPVVFDRGEGSA